MCVRHHSGPHAHDCRFYSAIKGYVTTQEFSTLATAVRDLAYENGSKAASYARFVEAVKVAAAQDEEDGF